MTNSSTLKNHCTIIPKNANMQKYMRRKKAISVSWCSSLFSACLHFFFLLLKVRRLKWKVNGVWWFVQEIYHYLSYITAQKSFSINEWTKLFLFLNYCTSDQFSIRKSHDLHFWLSGLQFNLTHDKIFFPVIIPSL